MSLPLTLPRAARLLRLPYRAEVVFWTRGGGLESGLSLLDWAEIALELESEADGAIFRVEGDRILDAAGAVVVELRPGRAWAYWTNAKPYTYAYPDPAGDGDAWRAWATQGPLPHVREHRASKRRMGKKAA